MFRNRTIFNTLNRTENLLLYYCSHRPRNSHPHWTSRFFLQVFKWAQRSSVVLGVCVCLVCLFNLPMEHQLGFSCEMQGYFPRKSFREKTETNNRFALSENALAQSISCLCVSAWWCTGIWLVVCVMANNMNKCKKKMDRNNGQNIQ